MSIAIAPPALQGALLRRGFAALTEVQSAVLAADDGSRDLQITSQTGSGKTVALGFVLAARLALEAPNAVGPTTLILAPTRELAAQVRDELSWLFAELASVKVDAVTGGTHVGAEQTRLIRKPRVLVATPGRLLDHLRTGALDLSSVDQVVLDEADQMLDLGFRDDLLAILASMPTERRTHLVSATFPNEVRDLTRKYQRDALHVEGTALGAANLDIEHVVHSLDAKERYAALVNLLLLRGDERTLVFVRTRAQTAEIADKLTADGFAAQPISGDLSQVLRTRTLTAFKRGLVTALIATDVAARGLDIQDVTMVVHYDPPMDGGVYTHRSGRTGRAGQKGHSVMFSPRGVDRRVRRILESARVKASWQPVPDRAAVQRAQDERAEANLRDALAKHDVTPQQLALAQKLLAEHEAQALVAGLLGALAAHGPRTAFDVGVQTSARPQSSPTPTTEPRSEPRSRREVATDTVRFKINWGSSQRAEPKRILAHICRRGGINSQDVGTIEVRALHSVFDVSAQVADEFAERVAVRDSRDPHLVIEPFPRRGSAATEPRTRELPTERRPLKSRGDVPRPSKSRFAKTSFGDRTGKPRSRSTFDWS